MTAAAGGGGISQPGAYQGRRQHKPTRSIPVGTAAAKTYQEHIREGTATGHHNVSPS